MRQKGSDVRPSAGAALVLTLSSVLLGGCVGIAHVRATAPEIQLTVRGANQQATVDIVCALYNGEPEGFVVVVNRSLRAGAYGYEWRRVLVGASDGLTTCGEQSRYIGYPYSLLGPTGPRSATTMRRTLFVHLSGERLLYRVRVRGRSARVESTSLDDAESRFPARLNEPEPAPLDPQWTARIHLRRDYYDATKWRSSSRLTVAGVDADRRGAISSLIVEVR
jgi:hypothetical protein